VVVVVVLGGWIMDEMVDSVVWGGGNESRLLRLNCEPERGRERDRGKPRRLGIWELVGSGFAKGQREGCAAAAAGTE